AVPEPGGLARAAGGAADLPDGAHGLGRAVARGHSAGPVCGPVRGRGDHAGRGAAAARRVGGGAAQGRVPVCARQVHGRAVAGRAAAGPAARD
ncbi:hypothetical protein BN1708_018904, partial [Verticillium longisporum]